MVKQFFNNWNFIRWVRLGLGIAITIQSIYAHEMAMVAMGVLFTGMAVFNIGCCGAGACTLPARKNSGTTKNTDYKETV